MYHRGGNVLLASYLYPYRIHRLVPYCPSGNILNMCCSSDEITMYPECGASVHVAAPCAAVAAAVALAVVPQRWCTRYRRQAKQGTLRQHANVIVASARPPTPQDCTILFASSASVAESLESVTPQRSECNACAASSQSERLTRHQVKNNRHAVHGSVARNRSGYHTYRTLLTILFVCMPCCFSYQHVPSANSRWATKGASQLASKAAHKTPATLNEQRISSRPFPLLPSAYEAHITSPLALTTQFTQVAVCTRVSAPLPWLLTGGRASTTVRPSRETIMRTFEESTEDEDYPDMLLGPWEIKTSLS
eukprot:2036503-Pleurochrysis_carterae.AAC.1